MKASKQSGKKAPAPKLPTPKAKPKTFNPGAFASALKKHFGL